MQIDPEVNAPRASKRTAVQADIVADEAGGPDAYHIYLDNFTKAGGGSSHFFGAGQVGAPGVTQYPNWKPPSPCTAKHNKTFYLELENTNFTYMDTGLLAPYYSFPWQYIPWYLHPGEFDWYGSCTNFCRFKSVRFQINVIGARLPFTTNDETASVANSQVDQMLDVYRSMEKIFPFELYDTKNTRTVATPEHVHDLLSRLYEGMYANSTNANGVVSACQGYRRWHAQPLFPNGQDLSGLVPSTFPAFAHNKIMSADLRTFRGPLAEMSHVCKSGIIQAGASVVSKKIGIGSKPLTPYSASLYKHPTIYYEHGVADPSPQNSTVHKVDSFPVYHYFNGLLQKNEASNGTLQHVPRLESLAACSGAGIRDKSLLPGLPDAIPKFMDPYHQTIEGSAWSSGNQFNAYNFPSMFMGVRPQMNGSKYQQGITQIEIKTECEIEYQVYWPNPTAMPTQTTPDYYDFGSASGLFGLTNDIDRALLFPGWQQPGYVHHHKQPWLVYGETTHQGQDPK